ncbi:helix-turn-helix transcriptional regulator [Salmonella enterica]|uniref:XRE family transcriptional regulator n=2 Tax=Salmonella newport TaxID=108619 RepID=A0A5X8XUS9_SALNE|nr:helix-turn-helix transcriptional regulator [Salmonella enterica]EBS4089002.1 XRE family transcriptional regulator [Salmonella enterica subsp. enterica serovar Newport]EDV5626825.1 helix-turn-helix transcriptional regulator [Salmonella enterica subsp. enterica]EBS4407626.1 XRE family transcriptional regulator [Salmonella enterica subsp. enterica serovar Newport]EBV0464126.1 XRE family transcriptional regulator [Salmonella enterica subsp. enterica serovar Newport]
MFNVKRNGASVEITEIPASIPFSVFKNIADETGATETLVSYFKDKTEYEVIIQQTSENMAATVGWMASEVCKPVTGDADISTIGKRIGVARVKQHMSAQELEDAIGAPEGSVFRWETGKIVPSAMDIAMLADVLKCNKEWLCNGNNQHKNISQEKLPAIPGYLIDASANTLGVLMNEYKIKERESAMELALVVRQAFTALIT